MGGKWYQMIFIIFQNKSLKKEVESILYTHAFCCSYSFKSAGFCTSRDLYLTFFTKRLKFSQNGGRVSLNIRFKDFKLAKGSVEIYIGLLNTDAGHTFQILCIKKLEVCSLFLSLHNEFLLCAFLSHKIWLKLLEVFSSIIIKCKTFKGPW